MMRAVRPAPPHDIYLAGNRCLNITGKGSPPQRKRIRRRTSSPGMSPPLFLTYTDDTIVDDDPPATEEQTTSASSTSVNFVSAEEWEGVCEVLKKCEWITYILAKFSDLLLDSPAIKQAKAIDRKRLAAQFAKLLRMDTEEAILKYNENFDDMRTCRLLLFSTINILDRNRNPAS